ncbi:hypothetical protein PBY51_008518 [Eleginops maclovinus]|uniref:Uncharacterized protein n=1 Tax=Eleginops maclovinus TaxID=56733 RepID=A0AAN7WU51_ELEMC|nr:hypothetical protein PBY51_008518 [Eleginops maclovinus]
MPLGETRRGGIRLGGAHSTVVTSRERPSSGEATSGGAGTDGKEGKRDRRERDRRQRDRYEAGRQTPSLFHNQREAPYTQPQLSLHPRSCGFTRFI